MSDEPAEPEVEKRTIHFTADWDQFFSDFLDRGVRLSLQSLGNAGRPLSEDGAITRSLLAELNIVINALHGTPDDVKEQIRRISEVLSAGIDAYDKRAKTQEDARHQRELDERPCVICGSWSHRGRDCISLEAGKAQEREQKRGKKDE